MKAKATAESNRSLVSAGQSILSARSAEDKIEEIASPNSECSSKLVQTALDSMDKWEAKGVDVDKKLLEGRSAKRGFTMSISTSAAQSSAERKDNRAHTMPAQSARRGDFVMDTNDLLALQEDQKTLTARVRRGSVSVTFPVIPDVELARAWSESTSCLVYGDMTEGQSPGDEREWIFCGDSDTLLGDPAPIISCQKGSKGFRDMTPNQDNFSVAYFKNGYTLACAFDGHGPNGHKVSTRTVQTVPYYLVTHPSFPEDIPLALTEAFEQAQKELVNFALQENWDVQASGSTAVAALWKDNKVWTANAGDSRCAIGNEDDRKLVFETDDHKPTTPAEKARIEANGGEVRTQTYPDGWVNHRIFVKDKSYPGLCMARTFGDLSVKNHGVIATPDVKETEVDMSKRPFFVLASDGVWEFMTSEFVIKAVGKKMGTDGPVKTVEKLQREAKKRWRQEEGDYCDDITSILVMLR